jgi:lysophospholipase L1-like esterase
MTDANPQIYFLERIFAKTQGSQVLVYLSPVNQQLMDNYVQNQGYQDNVHRIDQWMATQPVTYVNLEKAMDQRYFADHLHMTPEGYQQLASMLLKKLEVPATSQN